MSLDLIYALIKIVSIAGITIQVNCLNRFQYLFRIIFALNPRIVSEGYQDVFAVFFEKLILFTKRNASLVRFYFIAFPKSATCW